jgi:hypothetical protein
MADADPVVKAVLILLCGGAALTSHSSKAASRLAVNQSPEPFSNIVLSLLEDALVPAGLWLAIEHPMVMLVLAVLFFIIFAWLAAKIFRLLKRLMATASARFRKPSQA